MPIREGDIVDGKYHVGRMLGRGGMGIVMEARHLELGVLRAMKVMQSAVLVKDRNAEERFRREARAAAGLKSEHVAHVYDVGFLPTGERYMVMEYLTGIDLKQLIHSRGPAPVQDVLRYALQACAAIAEAHKQGIIHRDIKSSNLFLLEEGLVKVIDWGLAKQVLNRETAITDAHHVVGSLEYMSPEQINGCSEVDNRSDIWSLGVVLYELITARLPFAGSRFEEILLKILSKDPQPPSLIRPDVPLAVDTIVKRCLQRDPVHRYAKIEDLADALRSALLMPAIPSTHLPKFLAEMSTASLLRAASSHSSITDQQTYHHTGDASANTACQFATAESQEPPAAQTRPDRGTEARGRQHRQHNRRTRTSIAFCVLGAVVLTLGAVMLTRANSMETQPSKRGSADAVVIAAAPLPEVQDNGTTDSRLPKAEPPAFTKKNSDTTKIKLGADLSRKAGSQSDAPKRPPQIKADGESLVRRREETPGPKVQNPNSRSESPVEHDGGAKGAIIRNEGSEGPDKAPSTRETLDDYQRRIPRNAPPEYISSEPPR